MEKSTSNKKKLDFTKFYNNAAIIFIQMMWGGGLFIFDRVLIDVGFAMCTDSCSTHALCIGCARWLLPLCIMLTPQAGRFIKEEKSYLEYTETFGQGM